MRIYVGNLPYTITEDELKKTFEQFGQVQSVSIIQDKQTGQSKGFGFIEMDAKAEAQAAIDNLNDKEFQGRNLAVNEARPRMENRGGGGRFDGGGYGSSGRNFSGRGGRGGRGGGRF